MMVNARSVVLSLLCVALVSTTRPSAQAKRSLAATDIDAIAQLVMLEDTRQFDEAMLARLLQSTHPEVRRRAVVAAGRIVNERGRALLESARGEADSEILATVVWATGQLKDPAAVPWLGSLLSSTKTAQAVAKEAAIALGKIRSPEARVALAQYLVDAPVSRAAAPVVGEALLSIGRFTTREDIAPIVRWATAADVEVRWRAAWGLFRPRDPLAVPHLLRLSQDPSADVRFWAVRGLGPVPNLSGARGAAPPSPTLVADWSKVDLAANAARLRAAVKDPDRRVRTEALRTLGGYDDDASFQVVLAALDSPDTWLSVSAAEALARVQGRADIVRPRLIAATAATRPTSLRLTALTPLVALAPDVALDVAAALTRDKSVVARTTAVQTLARLGEPGRARYDALASDPAVKAVLPPFPVQGNRGRGAGQPPPTGSGQAPPAVAVQPPAAPRQAPARTLADYRRIVERWVVPDYNGAAKPRATWETPRGSIEVELFPGDAPLGVDYFVQVVESGSIVGTEFGRLVPNFVAQQRAIDGAWRLRDEVSRRGLTRANLSWASAGLDTGRPGYTLGNTPQPHNEGDFTALGRVVRGMDVVDRLELGDAVTGARMRK